MTASGELAPADAQQFRDYRERRLPGLSWVRPGVWNVAVPFRPEVPYTLTYVLRDSSGGLHVVDPGLDTPENRRLLGRTFETIGADAHDVKSVLATHLHGDHMGSAAWLCDTVGAELWIHRLELDDLETGRAEARVRTDIAEAARMWGVPTTERDRVTVLETPAPAPVPTRVMAITEDADLPIPGLRVRTVHTPGHTRGHLCFALPDLNLLLTGDLVFPRANPGLARGGLFPGDDPVDDYLHSLQTLEAYDGAEVGPGHGYRFSPLRDRRRQLHDHVIERAIAVRDALRTLSEGTAWEVASRLTWMGGPLEDLPATALQSALRQTSCYIAFVRGAGLERYGEERRVSSA